LYLGKIIKIVATKCEILRSTCITFDFGLGNSQRSSDPTLDYTGFTSKEKKKTGKERKK